MSQNVLIGGGTGFVGQALCKLLRFQGCTVTVISRRSKPPEQITWGHIRDKGLPPGTDAVVNLSGAPVVDPLKRFAIDDYKREVRNSRIHTTKWLTKAISDVAVKPKVWISASGVGFYPTSETAEYDEDSSGGIDEYFATLAKEWEESAQLPEHCGDVRKAVVRIGAVLGNGGGVIKNIKLPFLMGVGGAHGSGKQYFPWVHIEDVAGIFSHIIATENLSGIFNAVSPQVATNQEFANEFAKSLNRPAFFNTPEFVVRCMLGYDWSLLLLRGQNVIPKRTIESGYEFKYPRLYDAVRNL